MTDNGTSAGDRVFNAGMKGKKGSVHEGGTRVPLFFRWPGKIDGGVDVDRLVAGIDMFPTIAQICNVEVPGNLDLHGRSIVPLLEDPAAEWSDRYIFIHRGRWPFGKADSFKHSTCAVRSQRYRLIDHKQLYDMEKDPRQKRNIAQSHPDVVKKMRSAYDAWWDKVRPLMINEDVPCAKEHPIDIEYYKQLKQEGVPDWDATSI
jgi:arylsulfatase